MRDLPGYVELSPIAFWPNLYRRSWMRHVLWRAGFLGIVAVARRGHPVTSQLLFDVDSGRLRVWLLGRWAGQHL